MKLLLQLVWDTTPNCFPSVPLLPHPWGFEYPLHPLPLPGVVLYLGVAPVLCTWACIRHGCSRLLSGWWWTRRCPWRRQVVSLGKQHTGTNSGLWEEIKKNRQNWLVGFENINKQTKKPNKWNNEISKTASCMKTTIVYDDLLSHDCPNCRVASCHPSDGRLQESNHSSYERTSWVPVDSPPLMICCRHIISFWFLQIWQWEILISLWTSITAFKTTKMSASGIAIYKFSPRIVHKRTQ